MVRNAMTCIKNIGILGHLAPMGTKSVSFTGLQQMVGSYHNSEMRSEWTSPFGVGPDYHGMMSSFFFFFYYITKVNSKEKKGKRIHWEKEK